MPRRHRGGRKSKPKNKIEAPRQVSTSWRNSPAAQAIAEKISQGGVHYLQDNFERVMIDSFALADEPEFADLYFDDDKTTLITARFAQKYQKRLEAAQKKGEDEARQVFDEMRIEVIDELAKPPFRKEVFRRLEQLANRLAEISNAKKLETVLVLESMLRTKKIPWGICGLILAIYERTIQRGMDEFEEEQEVVEEVMDLIGPESDLENAFSRLQDPEKEKGIIEKLEARPELRERLERQVDKMVKEFEHSLFEGEIRLNLFTQEEMRLPFDRLQEKYESEGEDLSTADRQKLTHDLPRYMRDSLVEIITPDRLQEIQSSLERVSKQWLREKNKWAMPLRAEIDWLDDLKVGENYFFMAAYAGQIRRDMESQGSGELQHGRSTPSQSRGLVGRARRLLRKDQ